MLSRLFALLYLLRLVRADSTNTTTTTCPSADATACNYRSVWSLLASCGLTLLICVWHAIHPSIPLPHYKWINRVLYRFSLMLLAFFAPEVMIGAACKEWYKAKQITKDVQGHGYDWWTMTHSHFVLIGGFVLRDGTGFKEIDVDKFLSLVGEGKIANPMITEEDIKDKSTSDALGKAILIVQLSWFTTQIIVRLVNHLAVTLVELDTVCMALLTFPLIFFCWDKPRCPTRPQIFYTRDFVNDADNHKMMKERASLKALLYNSMIGTDRTWDELVIPVQPVNRGVLLFTWAIFGAVHAIAWNYGFPTEIEKAIWRVASLTLTGAPVVYWAIVMIANLDIPAVSDFLEDFSDEIQFLILLIGFLSRLLLVALMLASLRSLPSSAHEIIPWTTYIPHL